MWTDVLSEFGLFWFIFTVTTIFILWMWQRSPHLWSYLYANTMLWVVVFIIAIANAIWES